MRNAQPLTHVRSALVAKGENVLRYCENCKKMTLHEIVETIGYKMLCGLFNLQKEIRRCKVCGHTSTYER